MKELDSAKVLTLVDNSVWREGLASSWGLSLYVEMCLREELHVMLMDTSGSFNALTKNISQLGVKLSDIQAIFISHWHGDHCGSLRHILPSLTGETPVYVPSEHTSRINEIRNAGGTPKICFRPLELMDGVMSTGVVGTGISEHSMLMNLKNKGLVILTGCAHPGIIEIIKQAQRVSAVSEVYAIIGGLHVSTANEGTNIAKSLHKMRVDLISPCHCTGTDAKKAIASIMREKYAPNGSGRAFLFSSS